MKKTALLYMVVFLCGVLTGWWLFNKDVRLIVSPDDPSLFLKAIHSAKREILVSVYVITNDEIVQALKQARERGVRVIVLVDGDLGANAKAVKELRSAGCTVKCIGKAFKHFHAKYMVIDNEVVIVGSHNLTYSAMAFNREVSLFVDNHLLASQLRALFFSDYRKAYICFTR